MHIKIARLRVTAGCDFNGDLQGVSERLKVDRKAIRRTDCMFFSLVLSPLFLVSSIRICLS